ncbi:tektin-1-like [Antedon mediterranea]|uniref:tektin-1-like n=1 Tax=Antedon mediterranea TaxID=105859 RepID=UPI003AF8D212
MAKLIQAPSVFTHPEWTLNNHLEYDSAEKQRASAERLIAESDRLIDETDKTTKKTQRDVNKKFDQRIDNVTFWKDELDRKLDDSKQEIDMLLAYKTRLESAFEACKEPLAIVTQCLANRESRVAIDLVHDDVQKNLIKEREVIQGVMALLQRTLEQTTEQIRVMRSKKYYLEKDLKDKFQALSIDGDCRELRDDHSGLRSAPGSAKIEANSVTPESWQDFSDENITKAEKQRKCAVDLRSIIDSILTTTANDMQQQVDDTNLAFNKRIEETATAKSKLEAHLGRVLGQIRDMEGNIEKLQKSIDDKVGPMKLSETRLNARATRPNVELCRDPVQYRLINEVSEIDTNVKRLQETLAQAEMELKGLIRNQLRLEEDIDVKSNTLNIDEANCMGIRKSVFIKKF